MAFISIRLDRDPQVPTYVYVNQTNTPKPNVPDLQRFTVEASSHISAPGEEAHVEAGPIRWPVIYPSPVLMRLGAQWSHPIEELPPQDRHGLNEHRSHRSIEFVFDKAAKTLSWTQAGGGLTGCVKFTDAAPVWLVVLRPAGNGGEVYLKVNGQTIAKTP